MSRKRKANLIRIGVVLAVLTVAFLASGVILAQSSPDYDLGCRAELTAGGYAASYTDAGVILHSSVGNWNGGRTAIQGSGIVIDSGYILPGLSGSVASASSASMADVDAIGDGGVFLPALYAVNTIRFVRPCNWPWAAAALTTN